MLADRCSMLGDDAEWDMIVTMLRFVIITLMLIIIVILMNKMQV